MCMLQKPAHKANDKSNKSKMSTHFILDLHEFYVKNNRIWCEAFVLYENGIAK